MPARKALVYRHPLHGQGARDQAFSNFRKINKQSRSFGSQVRNTLGDVERTTRKYNLLSTGLGLAGMVPSPYAPAFKAGAIGASILGYGAPKRRRRKTAVKKRPKKRKAVKRKK